MLHPYNSIENSPTPQKQLFADASTATAWHTPYTWIEISKSAFEHNVALYKKIIGAAVNLGVVVKSNAYGHGIVEIGTLCQTSPHVDWLCTTSLSEALVLRKHGVTKPILVTCIIDQDPTQAVEQSIDLVVYDMHTIAALNNCAAQLGKPANIHIKIDTGMSRFGIYPHDALAFIQEASLLPYIKINGICSHFSESDATDTHYTTQQLEQFNAVLKQLDDALIRIPIKHTGNSAAVTAQTKSHFNLVRVGAAAYGLQQSESSIEKAQRLEPTFALKPVMSWKTKLLNIKTIPAHTPVGYNRTHITTETTTIGILPIGYYEGYDRRLSNKGSVFVATNNVVRVAEQYASVIGRVCMNVTMIDISHIKNAKVGDHVLLLGDHPDIRAHEIAHAIGSFNPREITTRISPTIARIVTE